MRRPLSRGTPRGTIRRRQAPRRGCPRGRTSRPPRGVADPQAGSPDPGCRASNSLTRPNTRPQKIRSTSRGTSPTTSAPVRPVRFYVICHASTSCRSARAAPRAGIRVRRSTTVKKVAQKVGARLRHEAPRRDRRPPPKCTTRRTRGHGAIHRGHDDGCRVSGVVRRLPVQEGVGIRCPARRPVSERGLRLQAPRTRLFEPPTVQIESEEDDLPSDRGTKPRERRRRPTVTARSSRTRVRQSGGIKRSRVAKYVAPDRRQNESSSSLLNIYSKRNNSSAFSP